MSIPICPSVSITCGICMEDFNDNIHKPYLLNPCGHTFCHECVLKLNEKKMACSTCKQVIQSTTPNYALIPNETTQHIEEPPKKPVDKTEMRTFTDGNKYEGDWSKDDTFNGFGKYYWLDDSEQHGDRFEGEWRDGKQHGHGVYYYANGSQYDGAWKLNKKQGPGTFTYANYDRYEGQWKNDKKSGIGKLFYNNGDRYEGKFKEDGRSGPGKFYYINGNRYEGDFKDDKMHGHGVFYWTDGRRYIGDWKNGKKNGHGKYYLVNGDRYEGDWKEDKKNGEGRFYCANGDRYEGDWKENREYNGVFYSNDKIIFSYVNSEIVYDQK